jgi:hypothetical protein
MGTNVRQNIVTNGLVMYLDAGSRMSYTSGSTTWRDLSGNTAISGTLINSPIFDSTTQGSIIFNGTNQYINCGTELSQSGDWSISTFVKLSVTSSTRVIMARSAGSPSFQQNYALAYGGYTGNNGTKFAVGTSADSYKAAIGVTTVQTGSWYHVVGTYNSTSKILSLYVNGTLDGTTTGTTLPPTTGSQFVQVGCSDGTSTPANFWSGSIAQVSIYNRALSAQEIAQNYNATKTRFGLT